MKANLVAVKCKLYMGIFPSERFFEVTLANGENYRGLAPRHFCWNSRNAIVLEDETSDGEEGAVAAKLLQFPSSNLPPGVFAVEVPDGELLGVDDSRIIKRPTKISPPGTYGDEGMELPECILPTGILNTP